MEKNIKVSCPYCRKEVEWKNNKWRPFCSERCKMIDLGKWASEDYKVSDKLSSESDNITTSFSDNDI